MISHVHLYIIDTDMGHAASLADATEAIPWVSVVPSYEHAKRASGGLDALFVSLMSAIEWGKIKIPAPLYQTRVIEMPDTLSSRAHYGIPGIAIKPDDLLTHSEATRLILNSSFDAINHFNSNNSDQIKSVGAVASSIGLDKLAASDAARLIAAVCARPQEDGTTP